MNIKGKGLDKQLQAKIGKYQFEVGILQDAPKVLPKYGEFKQYAGQTLLKDGKKSTTETLTGVAEALDKAFLWLRKPFTSSSNKDVLRVANDLARAMNSNRHADVNALVNSIQAVVRNPILRGEYGSNSEKTAQVKGFDKLLMATGQFFKNIKARLI